MFNIVLAFGSIALTLAFAALTMLVIRMPIFQKNPIIKKISQLLMRYHKYIGGGALLFATLHGAGMLYLFREKINQNFIWAGAGALILFWIAVGMAFTMKRIQPEKKMTFMKYHKIFALIMIATALLHISLLPN